MGIGTGLAFIVLGAILAFAAHFSTSGIDIRMVGWILLLMGAAMLLVTFAYTRPRRRRRVTEIVGADQPLLERDEEEPPTVIRRTPFVSSGTTTCLWAHDPQERETPRHLGGGFKQSSQHR